MVEILNNVNFWILFGIGIVLWEILKKLIRLVYRLFRKSINTVLNLIRRVLGLSTKPFRWSYNKAFGNARVVNLELLILLLIAIAVILYLKVG